MTADSRSALLHLRARHGGAVLAGLLLVIGLAATAVAFWTTSGSGSATASAATLPAPTGVSGVPSGSTVAVTFTGVTPPAGTLTGYYVTRYLGAIPSYACGTDPGTATYLAPAATGCVDSAVANGTYTYTVTAVFVTWTATSAASAPLVVNADATPPTQVVTLTSGGGTAYGSGTTLYYRSNVAGSFTLSDAVTDAGSGPKQALFPAIGTAGWTHAVETVTSGTGAAPTITYTSSAFSWTANPSNPAGYTVTGSDLNNNTVGTALTFVPDVTGPTGGALAVNSVVGTAGGAAGYSTTGTFTGTRTNFSADAGSGFVSSVLTREVGALSNGVCGAYAAPTTLAGTPSETAAANGCYRYTLTGTDRVGNTSALTTVILVDKTAPSQTFTASNNGSVTGTTLYYRSLAAGSFTLSSAVTDGLSGPRQVAFPAIATAGWTHNAETVTTGLGAAPTITYASSTYSWSAAPTNPTAAPARTMTASDLAGNTLATALTFTPDNTAPVTGAMSVNGTAGSVGGTSSYSTTGTYTGALTNFTDAASGINTNTLTRAVGSLTAGVCNAYGAAVTVVGAPNETSLATGCYRYVFTGTDMVGNSTSLTTVVMVDRANPTQTLTEAGANAYFAAGTLYYRGNVGGSFTLSAAVSDNESGPQQVVFPAIATAGWTHNAETVISGSGAAPTVTYGSTVFTWVASPTNPTGYAVTGSDLAGNTVATPVAFVSDTTAPIGGALTVNGTGAAAAATTSYSATGTYTGVRADYTDPASGIASSTLTREVGTLSGGTCSAFGAASVVVGAPSEAAAAAGCYRYTLTGTDNVGNTTNIVTVVQVDKTNPTQVVSETGANSFLTGSNLYYRGNVAGSFTLNAAVTDSGTGPASATFPALASAGWTHAAETVTTGAGAIPTITYPSTSFVWTATPTNPGSYSVTGSDLAGNTVATALTFISDTSAPTGGALAADGIVGTGAGATGYSTDGTYTGTRTNFSADTGSGFVSSVLTREVGILSNGACSAYAAPTTLAGTPAETAAANGCYRYTLTGTDNVGNTATLTTVILVDKTAPTQVITATGNGSVTGATLYYKRGTPGSFTITSAVTDNESGPRQVTYPAMPAGWVHANETVTTGTGANPTISYTSSTYSWAAANPNNPNAAARTVTAGDQAGNTDADVLTYTADNTAPVTGALTINAVAATAGGSTSYNTSGGFGITRTDYTDALSGIASSTLTRAFATYANGVCGAYGAATTIVGSPAESGLTDGCYRYVLTGTDNVGNVASVTTSVLVDVTAPTQALTMSGGAGTALLSGTTLYYKPSVASSFTLNDAVTDSVSGPKQALFPAIGTAGWTHNAETITTGVGAAPTTTYSSTAFGWTASPTNPAAYTVTGSNQANGTVGTTLTFVPDSTGPTGGALTVNAVAGTAGTASAFSGTGTYTGTFTNFSADAGAGYQSTALTRAYATTLSNGTCSGYGAAVTIASISETNAAAGCYRYTLTGSDVFGNTSALIVEVEVDKTAPSAITLSETGPNAYFAGGVLFYKGNVAGSMTLTASLTDAQSGPKQVTFPAITTAGWTHALETVTAGTGVNPTIAYTSSTYSWTASPSTPTAVERTVTGADQGGNTITTTPTFTSDVTSPTGGALTVNGVAATGAGSTSGSTATSWTIGTRTDYTADTGSGFASSVLTREMATWNGTTCGTFAAPVTIAGAAAQTGMVGGSCYRYVLTGTDNVGNLSTLTTTVRTGISITSVTLSDGNGINPGALDRGDRIVVQFSGPISVSSLCSTWSGDTTNQLINADSVATVTIRNGGAANDYMNVTTSAAACGGAFRFGTLTLGDPGYLVSTAIQNFNGAGGVNPSTIAYNATTYTLTVTLGYNLTTPGVLGSNTVNGNTTATYAPDAGILGSTGLAITGTGTTATVRQF